MVAPGFQSAKLTRSQVPLFEAITTPVVSSRPVGDKTEDNASTTNGKFVDAVETSDVET